MRIKSTFFVKQVLLSLVFSIVLSNYAYAMEREAAYGEYSSSFNALTWISSAIKTFYKHYITQRNLRFVSASPWQEKVIPLLQKFIERENINVSEEEKNKFFWAVAFCGSAELLEHCIERGVTWQPDTIAYLSILTRHLLSSQRIEKLKLLIHKGYNVNLPDKWGGVGLRNIFDSDPINFSDFNYRCAYANVLLNATADPNFSSTERTPFHQFLHIINSTEITSPGSEREIAMAKAFLACGADYTKVTQATKIVLDTDKPYIPYLIKSFEMDKAALFVAVEQADFEKIKALAQRIPFKIRNAAGDTPLHHAVRTLKGVASDDLKNLNEEGKKSERIIILILTILPQLAAVPNKNCEIPLMLIFPANKFWMLKRCFIQAADLRPQLPLLQRLPLFFRVSFFGCFSLALAHLSESNQ